SVGLDGPDGTWISPVSPGAEQGRNQDGYNAGVINGSMPAEGKTGGLADSPVPSDSNGAVVVWSGRWPSGMYAISLQGRGTADLYVQGVGDAAIPGVSSVSFAGGV